MQRFGPCASALRARRRSIRYCAPWKPCAGAVATRHSLLRVLRVSRAFACNSDESERTAYDGSASQSLRRRGRGGPLVLCLARAQTPDMRRSCASPSLDLSLCPVCITPPSYLVRPVREPEHVIVSLSDNRPADVTAPQPRGLTRCVVSYRVALTQSDARARYRLCAGTPQACPTYAVAVGIGPCVYPPSATRETRQLPRCKATPLREL
ncbi:hypothetical protein OH77DRAFT_976803 [Trametes cingulata]|nr:hypothetical protein OH77DRAFT_976803 [Trametes cingulata]